MKANPRSEADLYNNLNQKLKMEGGTHFQRFLLLMDKAGGKLARLKYNIL